MRIPREPSLCREARAANYTEGTMSDPEVWTIHIDGAARGNPGPAAFAYVIARNGAPVIEDHGCLGKATNNQAEYTALIRALQRATDLGGRRLQVLSDSELLVKQMNGEYRVKNPDLQVLHEEARQLRGRFERVAIRHVPRAQNPRADLLCNEALDCQEAGDRPPTAGQRRGKAAAIPRAEAVREEAVQCLKAAAASWARGNPADPPPGLVWDQLWSVLEEHGILRRPSGHG
jgi:ribonuclease HI